MSKHWEHEQVHQDSVVKKTETILIWIKENRQLFFGTLTVVAAAGLIAIVMVSRANSMREAAWDRLFKAQQLTYMGNTEEANKTLDDIIKNFSSTPASAHAKNFKAEYLYRQGKYKEAAEAFNVLAQTTSVKDMPAIALLGKAASYQGEGDFEKAIQAYTEAVAKAQDTPLLPFAKFSKAQVLAEAGRNAEALADFDQISKQFAETYWGQVAKEKVSPTKPAQAAPAPQAAKAKR